MPQLDVLETIGLADATPSGIEYMTKAGAQLTPQGRLVFPRALVEDTVARAPRAASCCTVRTRSTTWSRGARAFISAPQARRCTSSTARPASIAIRPPKTCTTFPASSIRSSICISISARSCAARWRLPRKWTSIPPTRASRGTTKHVGTSWVQREHLEASLEMFHLMAGGEDKWRARPFVSQSNCFVVPPLKFAYDACLCLETAVRGGMPVLLLSAGQAGATAPAALASALVQEVAECLAGLVYVNAIKVGAPAIFGTWCFVSDLRTGAMSAEARNKHCSPQRAPNCRDSTI